MYCRCGICKRIYKCPTKVCGNTKEDYGIVSCACDKCRIQRSDGMTGCLPMSDLSDAELVALKL